MNYYNSISDRTKIFTIRIIKIYTGIKTKNDECRIIGELLLKASISLGVNIGELQLGKSNQQILTHLEISYEKIREIRYYLELLIDSALVAENKLKPLIIEIDAIKETIAKSVKKSRSR